MVVNELRVAGTFEIPDATAGDVIDVVLRVHVYAVEFDLIDVSGFGRVETVEGGRRVRVQAVALEDGGTGVREPRSPAPESPGDEVAQDWPRPADSPETLPPDYWETAQ